MMFWVVVIFKMLKDAGKLPSPTDSKDKIYLAAKALNKPIVVIPRRAKLSEHRNDHQLATAAALEGRAGLRVAWELDQLPAFLDGPIEPPEMALHPQFNQLVERISTFVGA